MPPLEAIEAMAHPELVTLAKAWRERIEIYERRLFQANRRMYGRRSERSKTVDMTGDGAAPPKSSSPREDTTKQLSERYPDADVQVEHIDFDSPQACPACGETMRDSGLTETSEYLDVKAKEFIVVEQRRRKHRCSKCHGAIVTAPPPPRVTPGGSYSDDLIIDVAVTKFCDLTPVDRYTKMAARGGLVGLPPNSLIQLTFRLAEFMRAIYDLIKSEVLEQAVLRADETPHKMLEGDEKKKWFLWGFSGERACFFECHSTRSGDVSTAVLLESNCLVLVSDVFSGYAKSLRLANEQRATHGKPLILAAYCNAHARREFWAGDWDSLEMTEDQKIMIDHYKEIYRLNDESKELSPEGVLLKRLEMKPYFEAMKADAEQKIDRYSSKSQMYTAYNYFLKNYDGLTLFLTNHLVPIDNNGSERLLRGPVIGRKTWYGTHSKQGAQVAAVHFTINESCKLNGVNPREYYADAVQRIHQGKTLLTPRQYKLLQQIDTC
jgi:transposase